MSKLKSRLARLEQRAPAGTGVLWFRDYEWEAFTDAERRERLAECEVLVVIRTFFAPAEQIREHDRVVEITEDDIDCL